MDCATAPDLSSMRLLRLGARRRMLDAGQLEARRSPTSRNVAEEAGSSGHGASAVHCMAVCQAHQDLLVLTRGRKEQLLVAAVSQLVAGAPAHHQRLAAQEAPTQRRRMRQRRCCMRRSPARLPMTAVRRSVSWGMRSRRRRWLLRWSTRAAVPWAHQEVSAGEGKDAASVCLSSVR